MFLKRVQIEKFRALENVDFLSLNILYINRE